MSTENKKGKVVLLGFDGMDYDLTKEMIDRGLLPNFKKLADSGSFEPLLSVFPSDSIPAWITAYTGLDPSDHGILDHVNYLLGDEKDTQIDTSVFHGKTFWDQIGNESDSNVCVINPFMAYPAWEVNGTMVTGPVFIEGEIEVSNKSMVGDIKIPDSIGGITDLPSKSNIKPFLEWTIDHTVEEAEFGLAMLKKNQPEFFFQTFLTTDRIQHHLWRYCDPEDPTYPGKNEVEDGIDRFFKLCDDIVGDFMAELSEDDLLVIMSDHGHGMRCTHCFNINEYFRRQGYFKTADGGKKLSKKVIVEKLKNRVLKFLNDNDLEEYISKIAKLVPNAKAMKSGKHMANFSDSMAYASDFAGTNPFGGICINAENVEDYKAFRQQLMDELAALEEGGEKVFNWLKPRESMYQGQHIDRYPDIIFEMKRKYGSGMSVHTDLFTVNPTHKKVSGGHKKNGIYFASQNKHWEVRPEACKITNLHATLLNLFDLPPKHEGEESFMVSKEQA
ncbi:MAG: hypothetical protein GY814_00880 [Gammaproteobacteria bacterium]|nr:hypothetical protein [Gammaproteobacteria bacterium]